MSKKVAIAYIPVLHKGYLDFLRSCQDKKVDTLYLVGDEILEKHEELDYLNRKDRLRALGEQSLRAAVETLMDMAVEVLTEAVIEELKPTKDMSIFCPDEDINRFLVGKYFSDQTVKYENVFLRWHRDNVGENQSPRTPEMKLSDFQSQIFREVLTEAGKTADWWRQVGAALVKDEQVLFVTHNEHMPEEELPNVLGDPRALFKQGININYGTAAHAETVAIAEAAKRGIATEGAELYVTDFPCPYCARLIAKSGIKKVYFLKGYAVLDGDNFLKAEGVEVFQVTV